MAANPIPALKPAAVASAHGGHAVHCGDCGLHDICLVEGLSPIELDRLTGMVATRRRVKRGEPLFRAGDRFDAVYPSFGYKRVDWRAQRARFRPRAERARSQDELVAVLLAMLAPLRDLHIWLVDPRGHVVPSYKPSQVVNFDPRGRKLALRVGEIELNRPLGVATWSTSGALRNFRWRTLAEAAPGTIRSNAALPAGTLAQLKSEQVSLPAAPQVVSAPLAAAKPCV